MIYRCPNCHGALEYDPASDKMHCAHCGNDYFMWELDEDAVEYHQELPTQSEIEKKKLDFTEERTIYDEPEFIECKVYTCSSCGAELSVSDTEVSTYCAYCGQPTIVYNRVDKTQKPKYIIPFKITKEEAENAIRDKFDKGLFVPSKIKNFESERVIGIYLPYFLYDVYYIDKLSVIVNKYNHFIEADCDFMQVCHECSTTVSDELAQDLEPYDLTKLEDFNPIYLSGFYADQSDVLPKMLSDNIFYKCRKMFENEIKNRFHDKEANLYGSNPKYEIKRVEYAFLPVWFMTFQYKNKPYTMMVNGQTGKVVGTIPERKGKAFGLYIFMTIAIIILSIALGMGGYLFAFYAGDNFAFDMAGFFIGFGISVVYLILFMKGIRFFVMAVKKYGTFRKNVKATRLEETETFVKERQGKL